MKKKIAVVGTGFAGLAAAWHLSATHEVTLIDKPGADLSASKISAGLLHPYAGEKARNNWRGVEGVQATLHLLRIASKALGKEVYTQTGVLRLASSVEQQRHFKECADRNSDVHWLSASECQKLVAGVMNQPGIWIESGITVFPHLYIEGLKLALKERGVGFKRQSICSSKNIEGYDATVLCVGAGFCQLADLPHLSLRRVKGQILQLPWPKGLSALPMAISSKIYLVMSPDQLSCYAGSTFEKNYLSVESDMQAASTYILPKLDELYPPLAGIAPIACKAGIRMATPDHLPFVKKIYADVWAFSGLGSKGLLYHALLSHELLI